MSEARLRRLTYALSYLVFGVGIYFAASIYFGEPTRLSAQSWVWFWQMPGDIYTWSIPPLVGGVVGLIGLQIRRPGLVIVCGMICSGWAFTLGVTLFAAVFTEPNANLLWFPCLWFLSSCYTIVSLSFTEEYL